MLHNSVPVGEALQQSPTTGIKPNNSVDMLSPLCLDVNTRSKCQLVKAQRWEDWSVDTGEEAGVSGEIIAVINLLCYGTSKQEAKKNLITSELRFFCSH